MLKIYTVNYYLESKEVTNIKIDSDETLLDSDITIINPNDFDKLWAEAREHIGEPWLFLNQGAGKVIDIFDRRKKEIENLLKKRRIIIVLSSKISEVVCETQEWGNRRITNYSFLPNSLYRDLIYDKALKVGKGIQDSIKLNASNSIFMPFYNAFKKKLSYELYLDVNSTNNERHFFVNRADKPVGFLFKLENGILAFLPKPVYKRENKKLVGTILSCCKTFLTEMKRNSPPE